MAEEGKRESDSLLFGSGDHQTISLTGRERAYTIHNYEVVVHASPSASLNSSTPGSNKVQVSTITNQNWELAAHPGHIVASNSHYLAYAVEGLSGNVLRLIHRLTNSRTLLKGFTGSVLDVAFAPGSASLLACVDQGGNLFVWNLNKTDSLSQAHSTLQLHLKRSSAPDHTHHRLSWCPYTPHEEGEDEGEGCLLAVSHGCEVEVYNLGLLLPASGSGPLVRHRGEEVSGEFFIPSPHDKPLLDLSLSPDGAVLATSSEDGHLKFWQVNWDSVVPDILHDFIPHGGDPVTRLIFCDNHTTQDEELEQFWRFLITGANGNREVKLWCTVSWRCLQTFHFLPPQDDSSDFVDPNILLSLDLSASYLIATDTRRMTLYVLQLVMDGLHGQASFTSITEYLLTQPVLSFVIAGHTPCPTTANEAGGGGESGEEEEEEEGGRDELVERNMDSRLVTVLIKLYCIQTRSMQELQVKFEPPDIMGAPPDPLPIPLFSRGMTSSEPNKRKLEDKAAAPSSAPVSNREVEGGESEREGGGEVEEEAEQEEVYGDGPTDELGQPTSLPSSFLPISSTSGPTSALEPFLSLPSLPGVSPKLVTPSAFLSAAKVEPSPSHKTTSPAALLPASPSLSPSLSTKSPHDHTHLAPTLNSSTISVSPANTLTSVTPSLEPSDVTLGSSLLGQTPPMEWALAPPTGREGDENKDDDEKERSIGRAWEREGGSENVSSDDVEELRVNQLVEPLSTEAEGAAGGTGAQEKFSEIFGLAQELDQPSEGGQNFEPLGGSFPVGVGNLERRPSPVRPQQMFTSTEKSEIVTISSKTLTPTQGERTEVVNTTGTPSAEFMELFSHQHTPRMGSKVTTPQGEGGNEAAPVFGLSAPSWMDKMSDNAASAWPDLVAPDLPKLVSRSEIEADPVDSAQGEGPGNVSEQGDEVGNGGGPSNDEGGAVGGEAGNTYGGLFPLILPPSQPAEVPGLRALETTEGETGQVLPSSSEQAPPTHDLLPSARFVPVEEGGGGAEEERKGDAVEESTGAKTPCLMDQQPSPPPQDPGPPPPLLVTRGGGEGEVVATKGKGKKKKTKTKQQQPPAMAPAIDAEARGLLTERKLTPSPTPLASNGVESVGVVDHAHLAQLYQLVVGQQRELAALRGEQQRAFASLWQQLEAGQRNSLEEQRRVLAEHARDQQQRLDKVLKERQLVDRQRQDKLISTVSQTLTSAVHVKLEKVVKTEVKTHVTPAVSRSLASVQDQLMATVQSSADSALKEGITNILHTKGLPEAMSVAVAGSIRSNIQGMYDETFRNVVLPAFERSCQELFRQLDDAFRRGISEYLSQSQQQFHQLSEPALQHLASSYHSLHSLLSSPDSPLLTSLQKEIKTTMQSVVQGVADSVRGVVREEVESALQRHAHSVDPQTQAVEERARKQEEIQQLLQSQEVNRAFETALSTSDLSLVLYLCQQVTQEEIFDKTPCPLSQPVLLSLIQQLSVDLSDHIDLKLRFLEASVLALDVTNDITKSHMTQVLRTLTQQLASAEQTNRSLPNSAPLVRSVRRLRMVTESLCPSGQ